MQALGGGACVGKESLCITKVFAECTPSMNLTRSRIRGDESWAEVEYMTLPRWKCYTRPNVHVT
jgi:hypothetical protein